MNQIPPFRRLTESFLTLVVAVFALACVSTKALENDETRIKPGLEIKTLEGKVSSFKDQLKNDKWNIVFVWTTYCNHCANQYPFLSELHIDHSDTLAVIGICLDDESSLETIKATQTDQNHRFPSVIAKSSTFSKAYEINTGEPFTGTPTYVLYNGHDFKAFLDGPTKKNTILRFIAKSKT